jgi:hypothetical protein
VILPQSYAELKRFLWEYEAFPGPRTRAFEAYARGDDKALQAVLEEVIRDGEMMMFATGNPCIPVPGMEPEPTAEDIAEAEAGGGEPFDPEEEGLEAHDPKDTKGKVRQGDEWKGDDYEEDWENQGEEWRGEG